MIIYQELSGNGGTVFDCVRFQGPSCTKFTLHKNISQLCEHALGFIQVPQYFLLDESHFEFFSFSVTLTKSSPLTAQELNLLVQSYSQRIQKELAVNAQHLFYVIDDVLVDGQPSGYVIGKQGKLVFTLSFVCIKTSTMNTFRRRFGSDMQGIEIYPESFFTQQFLKHSIKKDHFQLLYLYDESIKLITLERGFYSSRNTMSLGVKILKQIYRENSILQYFDKFEEEIEHNAVAKDLIEQSVDFYAQMVCNRLREHMQLKQDVFFVSSLIKNTPFMNAFKHHYSKTINGFVVPFNPINSLSTLGKKREPSELDLLIFLNKHPKLQ